MIKQLMPCGCAAALLLLAACDRPPSQAASLSPPAAGFQEPLPPPIAAPAENADPAEPPSYEVAIATAAAERNRAKKKCEELPEIERRTCDEQADAAFGAAEEDLADLRGIQQ